MAIWYKVFRLCVPAIPEREGRVSDTPVTAAIVNNSAHQKGKGLVRKLCHCAYIYIPSSVYILFVFIVLKVSVSDVRGAFLGLGGYYLSWVEFLNLIMFTSVLFEVLRVSKADIKNTWDALRILASGVVYLVLFMIGVFGTPGFSIFANTEFVMLMYMLATEIVAALLINARLLKRTIDNTSLQNVN